MTSSQAVTSLALVVGAAIGGFIRFYAEYRFPPIGQKAFPRATFAVNVAGSFILGLLINAPHLFHVALGIGFCGALTTFSGVSLQLSRRFRSGDWKQASIYLVTILVATLAAAWAGIQLGQML